MMPGTTHLSSRTKAEASHRQKTIQRHSPQHQKKATTENRNTALGEIGLSTNRRLGDKSKRWTFFEPLILKKKPNTSSVDIHLEAARGRCAIAHQYMIYEVNTLTSVQEPKPRLLTDKLNTKNTTPQPHSTKHYNGRAAKYSAGRQP